MSTNKVTLENKKVDVLEKAAVSQGEIDAWKAMFGHVYKTMSGKQAIIYRPIRRSEYTKLMLDTDIPPEEERIPEKRLERLSSRQVGLCEIAVLYPAGEELSAMLENEAGLASNLSDEIMDHSGFNALAQTEEL